mgnify:CR=1 FL=1
MTQRFREELKTVKEKGAAFGGEVKERMIGYVAAAFSLVAGLAWNDAIKTLIDLFVPQTNTVLAKFLYAVSITTVAVVITVYFVRLFERRKDEQPPTTSA